MTREDIIWLARRGGLTGLMETVLIDYLERFAATVAKAEREACAQVCDKRAAWWPMGSDEQGEAEDCAYAIRTRGVKG